MASLSSIDRWQLRRLYILAEMLDAMLKSFNDATSVKAPGFEGCKATLADFRKFFEDTLGGDTEELGERIPGWLVELEEAEVKLISGILSIIGNSAIELIHASCRAEGEKWGMIASATKGDASTDARRALLVLNDYLVDGMPADDNIEVISSEAGQITYNLNHCHFLERFGGSSTLAWLLCSARHAWEDGFFSALGGIAHQAVTSRCRGDENCMHVITLVEQ
jgi:hypothetical protein